MPTDPLTSIVIVLVWLGSISVGCIAAAAMVTYVRRTWQLIQFDEEGSSQQQLLDGIDRLETQLQAMSDRLHKLEERDQFLLGGGEDKP
jgi:Spy/CpxP family protein refolding chaperone